MPKKPSVQVKSGPGALKTDPFRDPNPTVVDLSHTRFDTDDSIYLDDEDLSLDDMARCLRTRMVCRIQEEDVALDNSLNNSRVASFKITNGTLWVDTQEAGCDSVSHFVTDSREDLQTIITTLSSCLDQLRPVTSHPQWPTLIEEIKGDYEDEKSQIDTASTYAINEDQNR